MNAKLTQADTRHGPAGEMVIDGLPSISLTASGPKRHSGTARQSFDLSRDSSRRLYHALRTRTRLTFTYTNPAALAVPFGLSGSRHQVPLLQPLAVLQDASRLFSNVHPRRRPVLDAEQALMASPNLPMAMAAGVPGRFPNPGETRWLQGNLATQSHG